MRDLDDFLQMASKIAKEEGLIDDKDDERKKALPDPSDKLDPEKAKRVLTRLVNDTNLPLMAPLDRPIEARPRITRTKLPSKRAVRTPESPDPSPDSGHRNDKPQTASQPSGKDGRSETSTDPEEVVEEQLQFLSRWYDSNMSAARRDRVRYWILKLPALVSTVSITAFESFGYGTAVIVLGAVAAFCVGVDAVFPGGQLYNVHTRAANEIRRVQHDVITKWRQAQLGDPALLPSEARNILDEIREHRTRIDTYVTDAEASLGEGTSRDKGK